MFVDRITLAGPLGSTEGAPHRRDRRNFDELPKVWQQLAKRRAREGLAAAGVNDAGAALVYWARHDIGADIVDFEFDDGLGRLWMLAPDDLDGWPAGLGEPL